MNKTLVTLFSLALLIGQIGYSQNTQQLTVTQNTKSQNTNNTQQEIAVNNGQKVNKEYYIDSEIKDELKTVKRDLDQDYLNGQTGDYFKSILSYNNYEQVKIILQNVIRSITQILDSKFHIIGMTEVFTGLRDTAKNLIGENFNKTLLVNRFDALIEACKDLDEYNKTGQWPNDFKKREEAIYNRKF